MRSIPIILVAFLAAGCQPPPETEMAPERTAQQVEADFDALRVDWQNLANANDPAGVAAFYADDAVLVDPYGNVHEGRAAIQGYFEGSFPSAADLVIQTRGMKVRGDMVAGYGTFTQTVQGPEGDMLMSGMWQTASMYQADGSVKIVLHTSMLPAEPPAM